MEGRKNREERGMQSAGSSSSSLLPPASLILLTICGDALTMSTDMCRDGKSESESIP